MRTESLPESLEVNNEALIQKKFPDKEMDFLEPLSREEELLALLEERNRFLERNKRAVTNILYTGRKGAAYAKRRTEQVQAGCR